MSKSVKKEKKPRGQKPHEPTAEKKQTVRMHAMVGTRHELIAEVLGICVDTLYKYYRKELDLSSSIANANVGGALYNKAISGDTTAMIFWLKTKAGFKERQIIENHDVKTLSDIMDDLQHLEE